MLVKRLGRRCINVMQMFFCLLGGALTCPACLSHVLPQPYPQCSVLRSGTVSQVTQQTRNIHPLLFQCWASVEDGGPTLKQHWVNAPSLLGKITVIHHCNSVETAQPGDRTTHPDIVIPERYQSDQRVNFLARVIITQVHHAHTRLHMINTKAIMLYIIALDSNSKHNTTI